ncbi:MULTISPECIES: hypothetical protein [unclassified Bradyrhizobium]|uniref:hypothetical protein n=1 Tax=unclassified Bradyrhizobium TaxID=2631580 RepID=UPI002FEF50CF
MALKGLAVVTAEHSEEGVLLEFWQDSERKIAIIQRVALDDTFDKLLPFGSPQRRLTVLQWNHVVQENLTAFERIIEAKYLREPSGRIEVDLAEIQRSGERFTGEALRVAGVGQNR